MVAGLLRAALRRPPSWTPASALPSPGSRCNCCGGRRWWREAIEPTGWCCEVCHPADHLAADAVVVVET